MERETLVIGDLHGHIDRLEALLIQEGLLGQCPDCEGSGGNPPDCMDCLHCRGEGWRRTDKPVDVVLVGDIGHFGTTGSPTGDVLTWKAATDWANVILWGNHDRAMVADRHAFKDFHRYPREVFDYFEIARHMGKLALAHASHGYLITHAGLHLAFRDQENVPDVVKESPYAFADWINQAENENLECSMEQMGVRDCVPQIRGGKAKAGGILWRDINEKLYMKFPQVFGHSADHKYQEVRVCDTNTNTRLSRVSERGPKSSYCIDIGGKGDIREERCLAGIYLPQEYIVRVDL